MGDTQQEPGSKDSLPGATLQSFSPLKFFVSLFGFVPALSLS